ncbi:MAG: hypothetical protein JXR91_04300, partial [Deltaproteobacteria bacterium]|nr:hypothetical protein [Deltaproteobacteria bacterium]
MADEKSLLQKVKLEISRSFKLTPYERLVFHKILAFNAIDVAESLLLDDLGKGRYIRSYVIQS